MELIKKHVDTVIVLGGILAAVLWMNTKFNNLEKEMAVMKAVMIVQGHYPKELATNNVGK